MVVRLLRISIFAYLGSFALPVLATAVMWGVGWLVQRELGDAGPVLRLVATIGVAAVSYGAVIVVLGRERVLRLVGFLRKRR
ncbi:hypothetical protein D3C86_2098190 [compost metagenome]